MATNIWDIGPHVQIDYTTTWENRLQQMPSLLSNAVTKTTIKGERKRIDQWGTASAREITGRALATVPQVSDQYQRWLLAKLYENPQLIDEWDPTYLGTLASPQSAIMQNDVFAYNRQMDATIVTALGGNAVTGTDGTTLTPLPSGQIVSKDFAAANSGLTFAKVAQAKYLMDTQNVPLMDRWAIISPQEEQDLIRDVEELKSNRYTQVQPITDGTLNGKTWMGFYWVTNYNFLTVTASVRQVYFWSKMMVDFGDGERRVDIDILPQQSHALQIRSRYRMGATRKQEEAVVAVNCYHA